MAKLYRSNATVSGKSFSFVSFRLGRSMDAISYNGCVFVRLNAAGIELSVFPLFRFFHPRLFIPWRATSDCKHERHWLVGYTVVYVSEPAVRMLFRGRLGTEVYEFRNQVGVIAETP